jgi:spore coat polysaccharide biosynthesis protein SpsF
MYKLNQIGCLIFARFNSKRLLGKCLKNIGKKTLLEIVYLRCKLVFPKKRIIIATTNKESDDVLINFCKKKKINFFRGSENNLIERSILCCKKFKLRAFARVCGDRPIFDYILLKKMLKIFKNNKYDLVTNYSRKTLPSGLTNEIVSLDTLIKIAKKKNILASEKQHMINYIYKNKNLFNIFNVRMNLNKKYLKKNFSINRNKDIKYILKIFKKKNLNYGLPTLSYLD